MPATGQTATALPIEDYAIIGNTRTAALVGRNGSIDWLCLPRFDAPSCFSALVGTPEDGRWIIAPRATPRRVSRRYLGDTLVLETTFELAEGAVTLTDFMPIHDGDWHDIVRVVRGVRGTVEMETELIFRFDYGRTVPWVRRRKSGLHAVAGPDAIRVVTPVPLAGRGMTSHAAFTVSEGQEVPFVATWRASHLEEPPCPDARRAQAATEAWWGAWVGRCTVQGEWREAVVRSLVTLKALTYSPTGAPVAAATTSLPEQLGGVRNWDYRYCWLRDATFTLYALMISGYKEEAREWREWLLRAVAGRPSEMQIMYGLAGERNIPEREATWLAGYAGSKPVRIGNAAYLQHQLDIYGEVMDTFQIGRAHGLELDDDTWRIQSKIMEFLEDHWQDEDSGIWEARGPVRDYTYSKIMAWVAVDRAVAAALHREIEGPVQRWKALRREIHEDVCRHGYSTELNSFVQAYGGTALDASLLLIPTVGFLPEDDPRVLGTIEAVRKHLTVDGFVLRYRTEDATDGLPVGEGTFLVCSFWLADSLALTGRKEEARQLYQQLLDIRNDVGLLAEEYDPRARRQLGNFPQAYSHVGLINTAHNLGLGIGPAEERAHPSDGPARQAGQTGRDRK